MNKMKGLLLNIDILGYKEYIKSNNDEVINALIKRIDNFTSQSGKSKFYGLDMSKMLFRAFSDNFVFAYECELNYENVTNYLYSMKMIVSEFLLNGFLVRGSLVYGIVEYNKYVIFGETMLNAYLLENGHHHPTIIVSDDIIDVCKNELNASELYHIDYCKKYLSPFICWNNSKPDADDMFNGLVRYLDYYNLTSKEKTMPASIQEKIVFIINEFNSYFQVNYKAKLIYQNNKYELVKEVE